MNKLQKKKLIRQCVLQNRLGKGTFKMGDKKEKIEWKDLTSSIAEDRELIETYLQKTLKEEENA